MPKQVYRINRFDGGLNTYTYKTDLQPNQAPEFTGVNGDKIGELRPAGGFNNTGTYSMTLTYPGYGLYMFDADYRMTGTNSKDSFVVITNGASVDIFSVGASTFYTARISASKAPKAVYTHMDGVLRMGDASFNASNSPQRLSFENDTFFGIYTPSTWYQADQICAAPASGYFASSALPAEPSDVHKVNVSLIESGTGEGWDKVWECAVSFVYDDTGQESLLTKLDGEVSGFAGDSAAYIKTRMKVGATNRWNYRIKKVNVYLRSVGTDDWLFQATIPLNEGAYEWNKPSPPVDAGPKPGKTPA